MIYRQREGESLRNGLNVRTDGYSRGFIFRWNAFSFGIRWQVELRRLYWRWNDRTRVLIGKARCYSAMSPEKAEQRLRDGIRVGIDVQGKFQELWRP